MANADWSQDLGERDLAADFDLLGRTEGCGRLNAGESRALADGVLHCMNGALAKVAESLQVQNRLRRELAESRREASLAQAEQADRIRALESDVSALRLRLAENERRGGRASSVASPEPEEPHLSRPLVLRSAQGAFLGVTDSVGRALCLAGLLRLVERGARLGRLVATCWEASDDGWWLSVSIAGPKACVYSLLSRSVLTPSGNLVTELTDIRMDGVSAPRDYMVQLFRQLRDNFQDEWEFPT